MSSTEKEFLIVIPRVKAAKILISSLVIFIVSLMLWKQQQFEINMLVQCNSILRNEIYLHFFQLISRFGMGVISILFSILVFLSLGNKQLAHNSKLFIFIILSFAIGSIAGDLLKEIIQRARPVAALAGILAQTESSNSYSFPSGHATKSMSLALPFAIMALDRDVITRIFKVIIFLIATLVCCSRIVLQKHYLSDVLAGISIALFFIVIAAWIVNSINKRRDMNEQKLASLNKRLGFAFLGLAAFLIYI